MLGDQNGILVLTTSIYKLTTLFGVPTHQLMVVRHGADPGHAALGVPRQRRVTPLKLGHNGPVIAVAVIGAWLFVS